MNKGKEVAKYKEETCQAPRPHLQKSPLGLSSGFFMLTGFTPLLGVPVIRRRVAHFRQGRLRLLSFGVVFFKRALGSQFCYAYRPLSSSLPAAMLNLFTCVELGLQRDEAALSLNFIWLSLVFLKYSFGSQAGGLPSSWQKDCFLFEAGSLRPSLEAPRSFYLRARRSPKSLLFST